VSGPQRRGAIFNTVAPRRYYFLILSRQGLFCWEKVIFLAELGEMRLVSHMRTAIIGEYDLLPSKPTFPMRLRPNTDLATWDRNLDA
jgi:hypothetical protein